MVNGSEPLVAVTVFLPPDVGAKVKKASLAARTSTSRLLEAFITKEFKNSKADQAIKDAKKASAGLAEIK
jgi:hypothetical protein